jgi:hypothetical protein
MLLPTRWTIEGRTIDNASPASGRLSPMRPLFTAGSLTLALACGSPTAPESPPGSIRVVGTVQFYGFEGGFWAVRGDDNVTYDPIGGLPAQLQRENLRVVMIAKVRNDLAGIHMAGPLVEIIRIDPI